MCILDFPFKLHGVYVLDETRCRTWCSKTMRWCWLITEAENHLSRAAPTICWTITDRCSWIFPRLLHPSILSRSAKKSSRRRHRMTSDA